MSSTPTTAPVTPSSAWTAPAIASRPPWTAGRESGSGLAATSAPDGITGEPPLCTYQTVAVQGSGKGVATWFPVTTATVYFDHPQHAAAEHPLNVDFLNPERGPSA